MIVVFGDSNAVGHGVSAGQDWPSLLAASLGVSKTILAASGHMAADQAWLLYGVSPVATSRYLISVGTNDAQHYGTDPVRRAAYAAFTRAIAVWCAAPTRYTARFGGMAFTGAWSDTPVNGIGRMTTQNGATATKVVSGTAVYVSVIIQNHAPSESVFEVRIDGALVQTVTLSGTAIGNTLVGRSFAPACFRFGGLAAGAHTVEVRSISGNTLFLEWIAGSAQSVKPPVFVGNVVRRNATGYASSGNNDANVAAYGSLATQVATELAADGLNVAAVDLHGAFNPASHLQADGIHYNPAGHTAVSARWLSSINPVTTVTYPYRGGTVSLDISAGEVTRLTVS